ncbi:MAG: DUF4402 domain-containing protein [Deltaproteobacteria bacterium]|jgi:hypothetical protein|nr:DUF4402 domain-containing protein [Deltaproteobacteria bacterium]MBT4525588.1 DUF4402 domain-containing protein [Deltaproteobacteria bacterium]
MKRSLIFFALILSAVTWLTTACVLLAKPPTKILITELSALQFTSAMAGSGAQSEVVLPGDAGAAEFNITGEPLQTITISILGTLELTRTNDKIPIETFYYGGSLDSLGIGTVDVGGDLNGIKIGAKINIPANPVPGNYIGKFKLRAVYQ